MSKNTDSNQQELGSTVPAAEVPYIEPTEEEIRSAEEELRRNGWSFAQLWATGLNVKVEDQISPIEPLREHLPDNALRFLAEIRRSERKYRITKLLMDVAEILQNYLVQFRYAIATACLILIGCGVVFSILSTPRPAQAKTFYFSIAGLSRTEIQRRFSEFKAIQMAPDIMSIGLPNAARIDPASFVPEINDADYSGFEIVSESKLFDMTLWKYVAPERIKSERLSPVVFTNAIQLKRIPGRPNNKEITFIFRTKGIAVDPVLIKPADRVAGALKTKALGIGDPNQRTLFSLTTKVDDHPEGELFTLTVRAIYWNGFNGERGDDAASEIRAVKQSDLGVLLPPEHSVIRDWNLFILSDKQEPKDVKPLSSGRPPRDEAGLLYWPIENPQLKTKYMMTWNWSEDVVPPHNSSSTQPIKVTEAIRNDGSFVELRSDEGKRRLHDAEPNRFPDLGVHFVTQSNTTFCGVASAVMVLNACGIERPISSDHGEYRLWTQDNFWTKQLEAVVSKDTVSREGMTLATLGQLIQAHGVRAGVIHAGEETIGSLRDKVLGGLKDGSAYVLLNYHRPSLGIGQTGGGHISPIAAYHKDSDSFLILDVARYRYESGWISAASLYAAASAVDTASGQSRGIVICRYQK